MSRTFSSKPSRGVLGPWISSCRFLVYLIDYDKSNRRVEFETIVSKMSIELTVSGRRISAGCRIAMMFHTAIHLAVGLTDILLVTVSTFENVQDVFTPAPVQVFDRKGD